MKPVLLLAGALVALGARPVQAGKAKETVTQLVAIKTAQWKAAAPSGALSSGTRDLVQAACCGSGEHGPAGRYGKQGRHLLRCGRTSAQVRQRKSLRVFEARLDGGVGRSWKIPADGDGSRCRELFRKVEQLNVSAAFPLENATEDRFKELYALIDWAAEASRFAFHGPRFAAVAMGDGVLFHCANLFDNRYWVLGSRGVERLSITGKASRSMRR
ncbi:MAG: hypothetical protein R3F17_03605 [Planctomycetota bacterium]